MLRSFLLFPLLFSPLINAGLLLSADPLLTASSVDVTTTVSHPEPNSYCVSGVCLSIHGGATPDHSGPTIGYDPTQRPNPNQPGTVVVQEPPTCDDCEPQVYVFYMQPTCCPDGSVCDIAGLLSSGPLQLPSDCGYVGSAAITFDACTCTFYCNATLGRGGAPTHPPTLPPTTVVPTYQPTNKPTYEPTYEPTDAPTYPPTDAPTYPPTDAPTYPPTTDAPTYPPTTDAPTYPPTTDAPTYPPTTDAPTYPPTTDAPTYPPTTDAPTYPPTTDAPTYPPTTDAPTYPPTTDAPTYPPTTDAPTYPPTTDAPTYAPTFAPTYAATDAPTTPAPTTVAHTTKAPTYAPTYAPTTKAPTTKAPTTKAPTTKAPTTSVPTRANTPTQPSATTPPPSTCSRCNATHVFFVVYPVCCTNQVISTCNNKQIAEAAKHLPDNCDSKSITWDGCSCTFYCNTTSSTIPVNPNRPGNAPVLPVPQSEIPSQQITIKFNITKPDNNTRCIAGTSICITVSSASQTTIITFPIIASIIMGLLAML